MIPQLCDLGSDIFVLLVHLKHLVKDDAAIFLRWRIQPLDWPGIGLLRQIQLTYEGEMKEVGSNEATFDTGQ